jgi:hypothetical protein
VRLASGVRLINNSEKNDSENHIPRTFKIIILAQAAVILSFTVAMYQEYVNNLYLQQYVLNLFRTNMVADAMLSMVTISVFAIGTFTLLGSMSTSRKLKEWNALSDEAEEMEILTMPVLETVMSPVPRARKPRRRARQRTPRVDNDAIYRSMARYAEEHLD